MTPGSPRQLIRVGISSCLLGDKVRYDGGHKRDPFVTDLLGLAFTWVPVCPEVEAGMGVPRESVRLTGEAKRPRMIGHRTGKDFTRVMESFSRARARAIAGMNLSGYILKARSPSCGMERVKLYGTSGPKRRTRGIFARHLIARLPHLPVEEEGRLHDPALRENFVESVFCYRRWQDLLEKGPTRARLVAFHAAHKYLLLAHSPARAATLGRLVARAGSLTPARLTERYAALFFETLAQRPTRRRHANVLQHMAGFFKKSLSLQERTALGESIEEYRKGYTPLIVPVTLIRHFVRLQNTPWLRDQVYLHSDLVGPLRAVRVGPRFARDLPGALRNRV